MPFLLASLLVPLSSLYLWLQAGLHWLLFPHSLLIRVGSLQLLVVALIFEAEKLVAGVEQVLGACLWVE